MDSDIESMPRRAAEFSPRHYADNLLGDILARLNRPNDAIAAYERADRLKPGTPLLFTRSATLGFRSTFGGPAIPRHLLVIDAQGAEAMVLRGARELLRHVEAIAVEVNFFELQKDCAQIEEIDEILEGAGFRRVATISASGPSWGDAFYVRR